VFSNVRNFVQPHLNIYVINMHLFPSYSIMQYTQKLIMFNNNREST